MSCTNTFPCSIQEQLAAFEAERLALLGRSKDAQSEVEKLSREYAKLLGHQNQKQKIRHVLKLKEENNNLKQVCKLVSFQDLQNLFAMFYFGPPNSKS